MHSYDSTHPLIQAYTKHHLLVRCDDKVKTSEDARDNDLSLPLADPTSLNLSDYDPAETPSFAWGSWKVDHFCQKISECYDEMVTWKRNIF